MISSGRLSDGSSWFDVVERIKDLFTVHVVTRRGLGDSGSSPDYDIEREYEDMG